ncbi:hypothetical protein PHMEG_00010161 [Phytophthora megakarya]|uniref:Uncharacterized protein n=1 Tax=Phytophthora megakarya TaxID=4795 RepID=A0A225WED6_9STRA|nr:hypothetical protein PHMEG_00010161 [Phytophthora megakarya]
MVCSLMGALNSEYFFAVFGRYEHSGKPRSPLFALAPLINQDGDGHSAGNHVTFLREMRLNLTVQLMLVAFKAIQIKFKISLRPVLRQQTRWSSTIGMVNRYVNLLEVINDDDGLADYLPSSAANRWLRKLLDG